ncbi:MAG: efflux RND transporter permease subunit [bacterium]|nr:efflux RND transporter permease subunit [bacterium]
MNGVIAWFVKNRVAANVLMLLLVAGGIVVLPAIRVEVFPEFSADLVTVTVPYPGAAPEEVEEGVCVRIEEEVFGLNGIKRIRSTASEGIGSVSIEVRPDADVRAVLSDVKNRVDGIDTFPVEAERPIVEETIPRAQVINVAVYGPLEEDVLKRQAERVRDDLRALDEISQVVMAIARPYEISIEVSELALLRYGLTFDEVAQAVRRSSLEVPGGSIKTESGEILLRTDGQAYVGEDFREIVLRTARDGKRLVLGDVAEVVDGFEDTDQAASFDGQRTVILQVFRVGDESALAISGAVKDYVAAVQDDLPEGLEVTAWRDDAKYLRGRLETLIRNGWQGLLLVFLVLTLFLRFQLSFWVTIGIPISFLGTLMLFPALDVSINVLSLFAFIVVLGIVVDDAIVVGESIYRRLRAGEPGEHAAIAGTRQVAVPVAFAVLTSVAAFAPMAGLEGFTGRIWRVIPMVVIPTLLFSLVESQLILPAHLVHLKMGARGKGLVGVWQRFQSRIADGLEAFIGRVYRPTLGLALRARYVTLGLAIACVVLTAGLAAGGFIQFRFFPKLPADDVSCQVTMPLGTPSVVTAAAVERVEAAALEIAAEEQSGDGGPIEHLLASIGEQPWRKAQAQNAGVMFESFTGSHVGEVHIALTPSEDRSVAAGEIVRRWRERAGAIPGAVEVTFTSELMTAGAAVDVELTAPELGLLRAAADELKATLADYQGVYDVTDSFREGKREVALGIRPAAEALGLTLADLGTQVRQGFYGEEAQRVQRGRDDVKVMVRYPAADRRSLATLEDMRIRTPDGAAVAFETVADASFGRGFSTIERTDRRRTLHVTAEVDEEVASATDVVKDLRERVLPELIQGHDRVTWSFEGEQREQRETLGGLMRGFGIAMIVIYGLMAVPFRSYLQPLIVMSAVPFGMVGAFLGHLIVGMDMNVLSMCGMIALAGVVVNDNLVLVDYINTLRARGENLAHAVQEAGAARFRPILLTSLTTFAGLTPLMLETSIQALFLIPMAVSLAFGVLFSTSVSLVLVPSLYMILEDLKGAPRKLRGRAR